jgi:hypothetical protein
MKKLITLLIVVFTFQLVNSQELYVGANSEFYLNNNIPFTTSNTVVTMASTGIFSVAAGATWGSAQEYVDGKVTGYGTGTTKLPVGNNGVYAPVTATHTGNITATYVNATPTSGTNGTNVDDVSTVEYWQLTGNAVITLPWNSASDITTLVNNNGGVLNSVAIVGLNGGTWNLVSAPHTNTVTGTLTDGTATSDAANEVNLNGFSEVTFGIDHQAVLSTDDLFLSTDIRILSNPVQRGEQIRFSSSNDLTGLEVTLFDLSGRKLKTYQHISSVNGIGELQKIPLSSGVYILRFEQEGKQGIKKIIIE